MKVHITNIYGQSSKSVALVAQNAVAKIAQSLGYKELGIYCYDGKNEPENELNARIDGIIASVSNGDIVIFQNPTWNSMDFDEKILGRLKGYSDIKIVIFVHDVVPLMFESNRYLLDRIIKFYNMADTLILPSKNMEEYLRTVGLTVNKVVYQEMWDYVTEVPQGNPVKQNYINFLGEPTRFNFVNTWNYSKKLRVFSSKKIENETFVENMGWFEPLSLLKELGKGGFGLVWNEDENGRRYTELTAPYKLSTYLVAGIPIIARRGVSSEKIITENGLGIIVDSIDEAMERVEKMSDEEYHEMALRVKKFSQLLRNGYFAKRLLINAVHEVLRNDLEGGENR